MKIFPLKPMSNYDKLNNLIKILGNNKNLQAIPANGNKFAINKETGIKYIAKENTCNNIIDKYCSKISEIFKGIQRKNG